VAPGRYQILAAISAVHTSARDVRATDWSQIVALYDQLVRLDPSPVIALNRAIALAELDGPEVALAAVDRLERGLSGYHAYHATRADLLRRLGRSQQSRAAYDRAIDLAATPPRPPTSPAAATSLGNTSTDQAGCHSSIRLPSGSVTQPNRPTPSMSCVSAATSAPLARNCASIASRSRTRKLSMVCWARDPK
jgi:tetratricopeptide (TPR) repeat protein